MLIIITKPWKHSFLSVQLTLPTTNDNINNDDKVLETMHAFFSQSCQCNLLYLLLMIILIMMIKLWKQCMLSSHNPVMQLTLPTTNDNINNDDKVVETMHAFFSQ